MSNRPQPPANRRSRRSQQRLERPARERPRVAQSRSKRPLWQSPMLLVSVAAVVIVGGVILLNQRPQPSDTGGTLFAPPITYAAGQTTGETMGKADAPVTMDVYSDFQCPICARLVTEQFPTLKTQFVDAGLLRIVAHDIDILGVGDPNESLELATGAACAARQDRYWQYHDLIFWNHGGENVGFYDATYLAAIANRAGVDRTAWDTCMKDDTVRAAITSATAMAARAGINATPTLAFNGGSPVAGLPTAAALIAQIQALLPAASATP